MRVDAQRQRGLQDAYKSDFEIIQNKRRRNLKLGIWNKEIEVRIDRSENDFNLEIVLLGGAEHLETLRVLRVVRVNLR